MTEAGREGELRDQENRFWNAMKRKDAAEAARMTSEKCIIVGAQGVSAIDGPTMARMTEEGAWDLEHFDFDEDATQVRLVGEDVAIVAYTVNERLVVDGETISLRAYHSSVWVREDGGWRCALHTESPAGDPFGRDRRTDD